MERVTALDPAIERFLTDMKAEVVPECFDGGMEDSCLIGQLARSLGMASDTTGINVAAHYGIDKAKVEAIYWLACKPSYQNNLEAALGMARIVMYASDAEVEDLFTIELAKQMEIERSLIAFVGPIAEGVEDQELVLV